MRESAVLRDFGNGLILRRSTKRDAEALAAYNAAVLSPGSEGMATWVRDLMKRPHPTFTPSDFTIVEDTNTGKIVSSLNLMSQTWSYAGIEFGVGRPELVSTHPDYRRRGLIRAQFEVVHKWSAQRGEKMTAITGIPYFYRQFGYEMAVELGLARICARSQIPQLKKGEKEPYRIVRAKEADLSFIARVYKQAEKRYLLSCVRDKAMWRYELNGRSRKSSHRQELRVIKTAQGAGVGFLVHSSRLRGGSMGLETYELKPAFPWLSVTPSVLRYLQTTGKAYAKPPKEEFERLALWMGETHPVCEIIPDRLRTTHEPYAWYVRVPDLVDFLRHISPVLERRLAGSVLAGHTGEVKISFYQNGVRMAFRKGRLTKVESWEPSAKDGGQAAFPNRTFLQLLFGYRTLKELKYAFPDCWARGDGIHALLSALFPKQASNIWPVS